MRIHISIQGGLSISCVYFRIIETYFNQRLFCSCIKFKNNYPIGEKIDQLTSKK